MAKQQSYIPPMGGDANLIRGARFAAQGYVQDVGQNVFAGDRSDELRKQRQAMSLQADQRMAAFMDNMPANVDIAKVPEQLQPIITPFLTDTKDEYFRLAQLAANAGPRSPQYAEAIQGMNSIMQQYQNLNNDLTKLYDKKIQTLEDFEIGSISNGTSAEAKDFMTRLTTDEIDLDIDRSNGRLLLGEGMTMDNLPKMHYKDYGVASQVLGLHSTLYDSGAPLDKGREQIVRMQLRTMLDQGGPQAAISLATDDYIVPGGLGIDPSQYNPQELKEVVIDQYVNVMRQSAQSGYNALLAKENRTDARNLQRSINLANKKQELGITTPTSQRLTEQQRRGIDAQDRVEVSNNYMKLVLSGDTKPLIGSKYANQNVVAAGFVGRDGQDARSLMAEYGYTKSDQRNLNAAPGEMIIITDKDYFVVDPFDPTISKSLQSAIIESKFGADATTDAAIIQLETSNKPVLPNVTGPTPDEGELSFMGAVND
tara:strand:+ start:16963 stop:18411 length:1449 start_codon:yes stop_codon:yes gene_type:complete